MKRAAESSNDNELIQQFSHIERALKEGGNIQETTLSSILESPIKPLVNDGQSRVGFRDRNYRPYPIRQSNEGMRATAQRDQRPIRQRQGLSDPDYE